MWPGPHQSLTVGVFWSGNSSISCLNSIPEITATLPNYRKNILAQKNVKKILNFSGKKTLINKNIR
jgi:hypothetical protein